MTPDDFRRLVLSLPGASEGEHMHHPDFRVNGRIFATLLPDGERGMVKVSPAEQLRLLRANAGAFAAGSGAWGWQGCTMVRLAVVDAATLRDALTDAWQVAMAQPAPRSRTKVRSAKARTSAKPVTRRAPVRKRK